MSQTNRKAIISQLINLMMHILKWQNEPSKRSRSWQNTIKNCKVQIEKLQEDTPSLTDEFLKANWDDCTKKAIKDAEKEIDTKATKTTLTWDEVFTKPYILVLLLFVLLIGAILYTRQNNQKPSPETAKISSNLSSPKN